MSAHYLCVTTSSSTKPCLLAAAELFLFKCVEWCSSVSAGNETPRGELVFVYLCWGKRKRLWVKEVGHSLSTAEWNSEKFGATSPLHREPSGRTRSDCFPFTINLLFTLNLPQHADAENTHAALQSELLLFRCSQVNLFMSTYKTAIITAYGWHAQRSATVALNCVGSGGSQSSCLIWAQNMEPRSLSLYLRDDFGHTNWVTYVVPVLAQCWRCHFKGGGKWMPHITQYYLLCSTWSL